jgi:hypothetical protein
MILAQDGVTIDRLLEKQGQGVKIAALWLRTSNHPAHSQQAACRAQACYERVYARPVCQMRVRALIEIVT